MDYVAASKRFEKQWSPWECGAESAVTCTFPYNILHKDEQFVSVIVPYKMCRMDVVLQPTVDKYAYDMSRGDELGPSWGIFGKKLQDGTVVPFWHNKIYILDGNHRMAARIKLNQEMVEVIMPQSSYDLYVRNYNE